MLSKKLFYLIESVRSKGSLETAVLLAIDIIEQGEDLPLEIENSLIAFISEKSETSFVKLSKGVLSKNMLKDHKENIKLIAFLVGQGWLNLKDAAQLLSSIPHIDRGKLPQHFSRAADIADLVREDSHDGIMNVDDDDLLINALKAVI